MEFENKEALFEEAKKYEKVSSEELVALFKENHLYFPDFVDRYLLMNFFKKYIFDEAMYSTYSDEFKYRLREYENSSSIHLLEDIDKEYAYSVHPSEYKNLFMRFFLLNKGMFKTTIAFEKSLEKLQGNMDGAQENYEKVRFHFRELFYTPKGYLDGIALSALKSAVSATYTLNQIKGLGEKYNVDVPRRMNKQQLIDLISARFRLTDEEKAALQPKPILAISQYSKEKGFKISTDLKKEDMVEFIVYSLNKYNEDVEKDLYNYDFILDDEVVEVPTEEEEETPVVAPVVVSEPQDAIPTSNEYVEPEQPTETPQEEPAQEEAPQEETPQEEPAQETPEEEPAEEETSTEEAQPEEEAQPTEEAQPEETETPEEEAKPAEEEAPEEEAEEAEEEEYDESIDNEIRDIIKDYYNKKAKKDRGARILIIILFLILAAGLAFFALKYFNVF